MQTEDKYIERFDELEMRLSGADANGEIRKIARQEAERVLFRAVIFISIAGMAYWLSNNYKVTALVTISVEVAGFFAWAIYSANFDVASDRHLVGLQAQDIARLDIIHETHIAGEECWVLEQHPDHPGKALIGAASNDRWDSFWRRTYEAGMIAESLTPLKRRKRVEIARARALPALEHGRAMASQNNAELVFWARPGR